MIKVILSFLGAVFCTFLAASTLATQFVLAKVSAMGMDVTMAVRLQATLHDILGLSASYLPLIAIALLIALLVAGWLARRFPAQRKLLYVLAGAVGLLAIHLLMKALLGLSGFAATRSLAGLLSQGLAGALGGYVFFLLSKRAQNQAPTEAAQ